jgi:hypothetical protein
VLQACSIRVKLPVQRHEPTSSWYLGAALTQEAPIAKHAAPAAPPASTRGIQMQQPCRLQPPLCRAGRCCCRCRAPRGSGHIRGRLGRAEYSDIYSKYTQVVPRAVDNII